MKRDEDYFNEEVLDLEALRQAYEADNPQDVILKPDRPKPASRVDDDDDEDRSYRRMRSRRSRHQRRSLVIVSLASLVLIVILLLLKSGVAIR